MGRLAGTRTEKNLLKAFAGESQARNRYTYFSKKAKDEGYIQISKIFAETAEQEKVHAKRFFKFLEGGELEITASFPAGIIGSTLENLKAAAAGEKMEYTALYPEFAKIAREEGFQDVAIVFESIGKAESFHERRYLSFAKEVESGTVFKKDKKVTWRCEHCGWEHEGTDAPKACPACAHPQAYFYAECC